MNTMEIFILAATTMESLTRDPAAARPIPQTEQRLASLAQRIEVGEGLGELTKIEATRLRDEADALARLKAAGESECELNRRLDILTLMIARLRESGEDRRICCAWTIPCERRERSAVA